MPCSCYSQIAKDPDKGSNFTVMEGNPIANYLDSEGTYREWCDLLKRLDLFNALNLDGTFTCFVPKQEAFRRYMDKNGYASVNDIPTDVATYLVKYHIISTRDYLTRNFPNGKLRDTTESGDYLITEYSGGSTIWVNGVAKNRTAGHCLYKWARTGDKRGAGTRYGNGLG